MPDRRVDRDHQGKAVDDPGGLFHVLGTGVPRVQRLHAAPRPHLGRQVLGKGPVPVGDVVRVAVGHQADAPSPLRRGQVRGAADGLGIGSKPRRQGSDHHPGVVPGDLHAVDGRKHRHAQGREQAHKRRRSHQGDLDSPGLELKDVADKLDLVAEALLGQDEQVSHRLAAPLREAEPADPVPAIGPLLVELPALLELAVAEHGDGQKLTLLRRWILGAAHSPALPARSAPG